MWQSDQLVRRRDRVTEKEKKEGRMSTSLSLTSSHTVSPPSLLPSFIRRSYQTQCPVELPLFCARVLVGGWCCRFSCMFGRTVFLISLNSWALNTSARKNKKTALLCSVCIADHQPASTTNTTTTTTTNSRLLNLTPSSTVPQRKEKELCVKTHTFLYFSCFYPQHLT